MSESRGEQQVRYVPLTSTEILALLGEPVEYDLAALNQKLRKAFVADDPEPGSDWPEVWCCRHRGAKHVNLYGGDPAKHIERTYELRRYVPAPTPQKDHA